MYGFSVYNNGADMLIRQKKGENLSPGYMNKTGADQPVHPCSLISTFIICLLERIVSKLASSKFSIFLLVSVAEETGLPLALSETPKTGFLATKPI